MDNKGFTLIEVIMVVAIIALLTILFTPNVLGLIDKNNMDSYNSIISSVENAANNYVSNNRYDNSIIKVECSGTEKESTFTITLNTLVSSGTLSKIPENPCNKQSDFVGSNEVTVVFNCDTKRFSYTFRDKLKKVSDCKK